MDNSCELTATFSCKQTLNDIKLSTFRGCHSFKEYIETDISLRLEYHNIKSSFKLDVSFREIMLLVVYSHYGHLTMHRCHVSNCQVHEVHSSRDGNGV